MFSSQPQSNIPPNSGTSCCCKTSDMRASELQEKFCLQPESSWSFDWCGICAALWTRCLTLLLFSCCFSRFLLQQRWLVAPADVRRRKRQKWRKTFMKLSSALFSRVNRSRADEEASRCGQNTHYHPKPAEKQNWFRETKRGYSAASWTSLYLQPCGRTCRVTVYRSICDRSAPPSGRKEALFWLYGTSMCWWNLLYLNSKSKVHQSPWSVHGSKRKTSLELENEVLSEIVSFWFAGCVCRIKTFMCFIWQCWDTQSAPFIIWTLMHFSCDVQTFKSNIIISCFNMKAFTSRT